MGYTYLILNNEKLKEINFQFPLWDTPVASVILPTTYFTFNSLYGIWLPTTRCQFTLNFHFQFPLWDTRIFRAYLSIKGFKLSIPFMGYPKVLKVLSIPDVELSIPFMGYRN